MLADPFAHCLIDGSGMVQGSPHGPGRLSLGARFTMGQRIGGVPYRSVNEVVDFDEPRRIAWTTFSQWRGRRIGGQVWRYELEPVPTGTLVVETHDLSSSPRLAWLLARTGVEDRYVEGMSATLDRLARAVERPGADARTSSDERA